MAGLSFDSKSSSSAFLSAGIFSADSIADLVFSICSSIIHALPVTFYDLVHGGMGRAWKQPAISEIFRTDPRPKRIPLRLFNPLTQRVCVGRRVPSTQSFSILFSARVDWPGH